MSLDFDFTSLSQQQSGSNSQVVDSIKLGQTVDDFQEFTPQITGSSAFDLAFDDDRVQQSQNFDQWETNLGKILDLDAIGALDQTKSTQQPKAAPSARQPQPLPPNQEPHPKSMFDSISASFNSTVKSASEMIGATGSDEPEQVDPDYTAENFLSCTVGDYQSDKRTYRVSSQPKGTSSVFAFFQGKLCSVRRSTSDFEWFHRHLIKKYPQCLVPPIGETKGRVGEYMASVDYPQQQARKFQTFLQRVGRHPTLAKSEEVKRFISYSADQWSKEKSAKHEYTQVSQGMFSSTPQLTEERLLLAYNEIFGFKKYLKVLQASAHALESSYKSLNAEYGKWNAQLSKITSLPAIQKPATGWESVALVDQLNNFSTTFASEGANALDIGSSVHMYLEEKILSWVDYARAAQQLLERYSVVENNYNLALASFQRRKQRLGTCTQQGNLATTEGQNALKLVQEAEQILAKQSTFYNSLQSTIWDELRHYDRMKAAELNHWTLHYAHTQDTNHSQIIQAWAKIVNNPRDI